MNQFDKLIKDKINSKSYDYQPKAWRTFKRQSGMPMLSTGAKLGIGVGIATSIMGGILYFALPSNDNSTTEVVTITQEKQVENQDIDTNSQTNTAEIELITTENVPNSSSTPKTSQAQPQIQTQTQSQFQSQAQPQAITKPQEKTTPQPIYYGRPLEILVDTISSIDFPDYEVKPADMLP